MSQEEGSKMIDFVVSKSGKLYYKSVYDGIARYTDKNRERINKYMRERYHRIKSQSNSNANSQDPE